MIRIPTHRAPTHPGEMLREEFLLPMELAPGELAEGIRVPRRDVDELLAERGTVTPGIALRLAKFFDVSPDFWMNLQLRWDLYHARQSEAAALESISTFHFQARQTA